MIDYWNRNNQRHLLTKDILENRIGVHNIRLSAITVMELINGARNNFDLTKIKRDIHQYSIALIDNEITQVAIKLLQDYRLSHGLAMPDAFIAAACKVMDLKLFTHNVRDYMFIEGLRLYKA